MPLTDTALSGHHYSMYYAPRGYERMASLGMHVASHYLHPFDKLIGLVGEAGSGKSVLIKGMFPGLELTNDDDGVNVRPLPILSVGSGGFYTPHTYHLDIRFESAFTQMHELKDAILNAFGKGKRVVVEHFDLIYPMLGRNADLLIGIGEEIMITRPNLFGPEPAELYETVSKSIEYRRRTHSAEDLCEYIMRGDGLETRYSHSDVRHGFVLNFVDDPCINLADLERRVHEMIARDVPISYHDDTHIMIDGNLHYCSGPRNHVRSAGEIGEFTLQKELLNDPASGGKLMVGVVGTSSKLKLNDLNKIIAT